MKNVFNLIRAQVILESFHKEGIYCIYIQFIQHASPNRSPRHFHFTVLKHTSKSFDFLLTTALNVT